MHIAKNLFEITIALLSGYGILRHSGVLNGKFRKDMFVYYTNLSNLAVCLFFLVRLICLSLGINSTGVIYAVFFSPSALMAIALCILTTFIIYHFILVPIIKKQRENYGEFGNIFSLGNLIVHYFVPLSTLLYWILFANKSGLNLLSVVYWVMLPLTYAVFIFIRALGGENIEGTESPYPYVFMDPGIIGVKRTVINLIILLFAFLLMGGVFVLAARALSA